MGRNLADSGQKLNTTERAVGVNTTGEFKSAGDLRKVMVGVSSSGIPLYLRPGRYRAGI